MAAQKNKIVLRLDAMRAAKALPDADLAALMRSIITAAEEKEAAPPESKQRRRRSGENQRLSNGNTEKCISFED